VNPHTGVVLGEKAGASLSRLFLAIDVGERLPVGVADDEAGVGFLTTLSA
jgi:hypothetical protein